MLGKSYERIVSQWKKISDSDLKIEKSMYALIIKMTSEKKERCTMGTTVLHLQKIIEMC